MDGEDTYIVQRLSDPWKVLFLDADIALVVGMVCIFGFMSQYYVLALAVAGALGYGMHRFRTDKPKGYMWHLIYWYLPPLLLQLRRTPPAYCTEMIG